MGNMKLINFFVSILQIVIIVLYILLYNIQYVWSIYGTVQNVVSIVMK